MAALSTALEYAALREAIQTLTTTGQSMVSYQLGDMSVTYSASQLPELQKRERELAARLTVRNTRKRTVPDFS